MTSKIINVRIQNVLRRVYLLKISGYVQYLLRTWLLRKPNSTFIKQNRHFELPPAHLAYDAYSAPDWNFYKASGEGTADFLADIIRRHFNEKEIAVYEWGCGPGRVIRHLPSKLPNAKIYGSDYNPETIAWCAATLTNITFSLNTLVPPLPYPDHAFDFIYCISVFTHLSEANGSDWMNELYRVLRPDGLLVLTTAGDYSFETDLLDAEKEVYKVHGIVCRGKYEEGKKMYLTRHNPRYVKETMLKGWELLEHSPAGFPFILQDFWLVKKNG